jgi:carbonic anhydrase/acetyltransferase-like protein (isoleucine patch superfamily)
MNFFEGDDLPERFSKYLDAKPNLSRAAFVAPDAQIMGAVTLGADSSVFYGCILRADINSIQIGEGTNIQDGTIIHLADDYGVRIGDFTTVGHGAMIHACTIGNSSLIGMRSTILDGAVIGNHCLIAAGAVITPGTHIPDGAMVVGSPGKIKRMLTEEERAGLRKWAEKYILVARRHALRFIPPAGAVPPAATIV